MATYNFGADEHVESSMRAILELAGDQAGTVQYRPGVGPAGAVELPDDVADEWNKIKAKHDADEAKKAAKAAKDAEKAEAEAVTDDEDDDEDEEGTGAVETTAPATRTSRRTAAKTNQE
jgi:hypothetical protein